MVNTLLDIAGRFHFKKDNIRCQGNSKLLKEVPRQVPNVHFRLERNNEMDIDSDGLILLQITVKDVASHKTPVQMEKGNGQA